MSDQPQSSAATRLLELLLTACEKQYLKKVSLSKPEDKTEKKATLTLHRIAGETVLQKERFLQDGKALHENIPLSDLARIAAALEGYGQINLLTAAGDCELRRSRSGTETLLRGDKLQKALQGEEAPAAPIRLLGNDREKNRILQGDEPFLRQLGVSDETGRVLDRKRPKFRQINRFLELLDNVYDRLPQNGPLAVCDLCCGKSYLTFAVYHYLRTVKGREVYMSGVDLKPDVIAYCQEVAAALHYDTLKFVCGDVRAFEPTRPAGVPAAHLVVSLHACDIATDLVLDRGIAWGTDVILSTPCCHHELNHKLDCPSLDFIAKHSMLRQKFCDAATDAMRIQWLEANGYDCAALELIDPEETPKNILLRGIRRKDFRSDSAEARAVRQAYEATRRFLMGENASLLPVDLPFSGGTL